MLAVRLEYITKEWNHGRIPALSYAALTCNSVHAEANSASLQVRDGLKENWPMKIDQCTTVVYIHALESREDHVQKAKLRSRKKARLAKDQKRLREKAWRGSVQLLCTLLCIFCYRQGWVWDLPLCSETDYHATEPLTSQSESRWTNTVQLRIWSKKIKNKVPLIPNSSLTLFM